MNIFLHKFNAIAKKNVAANMCNTNSYVGFFVKKSDLASKMTCKFAKIDKSLVTKRRQHEAKFFITFARNKKAGSTL